MDAQMGINILNSYGVFPSRIISSICLANNGRKHSHTYPPIGDVHHHDKSNSDSYTKKDTL